jgi:hypothetical protein
MQHHDPPVPVQNLNPDILMMQPAKDWNRCDAADLPPKIRSISIRPMRDGSGVCCIQWIARFTI